MVVASYTEQTLKLISRKNLHNGLRISWASKGWGSPLIIEVYGVNSATSVSSNVSHSQLQSSTFYYGIMISATTLNISTHCITTLSIMSLFLTLWAGDVLPSFYCYTECHYASKCHYDECCYAECHGAWWCVLRHSVLSVA